jgi:hypothetical protein
MDFAPQTTQTKRSTMQLQIDGHIIPDYKTSICGEGHIHLDFGKVQMMMDSEFAEYLALNVKRAALAVNSKAHLQVDRNLDSGNVIRTDFSPSEYNPQ